jgi:hypothetical protein
MGSVQTVRAESFPMSILSREGLRKSTADQNSMAPSSTVPSPETRAGKKLELTFSPTLDGGRLEAQMRLFEFDFPTPSGMVGDEEGQGWGVFPISQ